MRTRLAILLALTLALAIGASALLTSQVGMTEWPAAPAPDTATRLITPTEAAGRATDRASDGDRDEPAQRAQRDDADRAAGDTGTAASPTTPVATERRRASTRRAEEPAEDAAATPAEPVDEPSEPEAPAVPATVTPAPVDDQHTRQDEIVPATPEAAAPQPDLTGGDATTGAPATSSPDDDDGRRRHPLRDLLDPLP
jgi:hypothetical protein